MRPVISAGWLRPPCCTTGTGSGSWLAAASVLVEDSARHDGRVYELTGPESLSAPEIATIATQVLGYLVQAVDTPPDQLAKAMRDRGAPDFLANGIEDLHAHFRAGHSSDVTDTVNGFCTGRPPRWSTT